MTGILNGESSFGVDETVELQTSDGREKRADAVHGTRADPQ